MTIGTATIFRAPIGEDPTQRDLLFLKERHYLIIESSSSRQSRFPIVEFGNRYLALGINEGLLIDPAYTLQRANGDRILCPTIARTFTLKFPVRFFLHLRQQRLATTS